MILEQGRIIEFDRYMQSFFFLLMMRKLIIPQCVLRPATLLKNATSEFYSLCRATGKEEFAMLKEMAGA